MTNIEQMSNELAHATARLDVKLACSRLSVSGDDECGRATCGERGLVEKEGRSGEPVSIVLKSSFRYTSSRYTLWLVNFDSLYQRAINALSEN